MINGLQNRNIVGSAYAAHFADGIGPSVGLILSKPLNSWAITSSRTTITEGGGIHFSATPLPATGVFTPSDLMTIFMFAKFRWDFGDVGAGTFIGDGSSRNAEHGPEAGHVFNTVGTGTYTVTLYVTVGGVETAVATQAITVNAADTVYSGVNTICFSNTTDFTGAPAGSTQVTTSSFDTAWTNVATGKRLMFKGGDTFTCTTATTKGVSTAVNDFMVESFGTGLAILHNNLATTSAAFIDFGLNSSAVCNNHSYRRIRFTAPQSATISYNCIAYHAYNEHLTITDCEFLGVNNPISASYSDLSLQISITKSRHGIVISNNLIDNYTTPCLANPNGNMQIFASGHMFSVVGNVFKNGDSTAPGDSHLVRLANNQHLSVRHNYFQYGSKNSRHSLKIHGDYFKGSNLDGSPRWFEKADPPINQPYLTNKWYSWLYNQFISIGENTYKTLLSGQDWTVVIGPQDAWSPEEIRGIVISNEYFSGVYSQVAIVSECSTLAIRNNVVNAAQWPACGIVSLNPSQYVIGFSNYFVYKNTMYKKNSVNGNANTAYLSSGGSSYAKNGIINNNLLYALPKDAGGLPVTSFANVTPIPFEYSEAGNVYDPITYPFTGTNPPGDSMAQFTLVTPGTGADVADY